MIPVSVAGPAAARPCTVALTTQVDFGSEDLTMAAAPRFAGVFPVAPTIFDDSGELDLAGQRRCIDFLIDAGSSGLCILANYSEQFALADDEREILMRAILDHVAGRVPVIVTTTHFSTRICAARSKR